MSLDNVDLELLWLDFVHTADVDDRRVLDWVGTCWPDGSLPALPPHGWRGPRMPTVTEGDGMRSGQEEWAALAIALKWARATPGRPATIIELGASQGPWCLSWVRGARALGLPQQVIAMAYEATSGRQSALDFWRAQDLEFEAETVGDGVVLSGPGWQFSWNRRAVGAGSAALLFPAIDFRQDNGGTARAYIEGDPVPDGYDLVRAVELAALAREHGYVHLLHLDIQGSERKLLEVGAFDQLRDRVGVLMLGTHSRTAEGLAMEVLPELGLQLVTEGSCVFDVHAGRPVLLRDGEQLWVSDAVAEFMSSPGWER